MPIQPEFSHLEKSILKNKAYTAEKTAELAQAVGDALVECMSHAFSCSISQTRWQSDNTVGYPYYLDIAIENIAENDRADVMILPESMETAKNCNFCPVSQTLTGKVRLRAASIPAAIIAAQIWIIKGGD